MQTVVVDAQLIEEAAYVDLFEAALPDYQSRHAMKVKRFPMATCFAHPGLPISLFNRVLRLGTQAPCSEDQLDEINEWMAKNASPVFQVGVDINAKPEVLPTWLHNRSMMKSATGLARFWRGNAELNHEVASVFWLREIGCSHYIEYGQLVQQGFDIPEGHAEWFAQLAGRKNWHVYIAYEGSAPVATGAMYIADGLAWLGVATTLSSHRGGGAQSALLNRRIHDAIGMGAIGLHIETGQPPEGQREGSSYRNILRAGFKLLFVREEYSLNNND